MSRPIIRTDRGRLDLIANADEIADRYETELRVAERSCAHEGADACELVVEQ